MHDEKIFIFKLFLWIGFIGNLIVTHLLIFEAVFGYIDVHDKNYLMTGLSALISAGFLAILYKLEEIDRSIKRV